MANSFSILHNFDQPLYTPDFNLIQQGLSFKQQKIDKNRAEIQNIADQIGSLKVTKDVDQEYINSRIQEVIDVSNTYASRDLSNDAFANSLVSNITQVLDDKVKNAVYSTKIINFEDSQWDKKKLDGKGDYSDLNREYALRKSDRQRYLTSENTGDKYKGGAGFIEYTDVEKIISDNLPKLAKDMEAEFVYDTEGNGYFRETVTGKAIDRARVEQAFYGLLGPKAMQQIKINAWGNFKDVPEQTFKNAYEEDRNSKLESNNSQLEKMKSLFNSTSDQSLKTQYQNAINRLEVNEGSLKSKAYDKIKKEDAQTNMYFEKFKDQYLDAYSYDPIIVKKEVNALDEATRNFELKLNDATRADKRLALDIEKFDWQKQNDLLKASATATGKGGLTQGGAGQGFVVETETSKVPDTAVSELGNFQRLEGKAIEDMKLVFKNSGVTEDQFKDPNMIAAINSGGNGQDRQIVKLANGKDVVINWADTNVASTLTNFKNLVLDDHPAKKAAFKAVDAFMYSTQYKLGVTAANNGDIDVSKLPDFNIEIKGDSKTGFSVSKTTGKGNNYGNLLIKQGNLKKQGKSLSASEQKTLNMYTLMHTIADPETDKDTKALIYQKINQDILSDIKSGKELVPDNWYKTARSIKAANTATVEGRTISPDFYGNNGVLNYLKSTGLVGVGKAFDLMPGTSNTITAGIEHDADFTKIEQLYAKAVTGDQKAKQQMNSIINSLKQEKSFVNNRIGETFAPENQSFGFIRGDYYLSDFDKGDLESDTINFDSQKGNLDKSIGTLKSTIDLAYKSDLTALNLNPTTQTYRYSEAIAPDIYQKIQNTLGTVLPKNTIVSIIPTVQNGRATGTGVLTYKYKDKEGNWLDSDPIDLSEKELTKVGVVFDKAGKSQYDASYGEYAPKIDLGTASIGQVKDADIKTGSQRLNRLVENSGGDLDFFHRGEVIRGANQLSPELGKRVEAVYNGAENGDYTFKYESNGTNWDHTMYYKGEIVWREPQPFTDLTKEEVSNLKNNSQIYNQKLVSAYLDNMITTFQNYSTNY